MSKGIYTAVSGAIAQNARLDTIANNLANVNTSGFKRDSQIFREYLSSFEKEPGVVEVPRVPASIESFYDMQGGDKSFVDIAGTYTDFSQGAIKSTHRPLDVAIEGPAFIEVLTPSGIQYSRGGSLMVNGNGTLVTKEGYPVLREGDAGADPATRSIQFNSNGSDQVNILPNGEVLERAEAIGKLSLVKFGQIDSLQKTGQGFYTVRPNMDPQIVPAALGTDVNIHSGCVEASNVNIVQEMTDMIAATRTFESTQKAIQAYDQMAQKLNNDVPKLSRG